MLQACLFSYCVTDTLCGLKRIMERYFFCFQVQFLYMFYIFLLPSYRVASIFDISAITYMLVFNATRYGIIQKGGRDLQEWYMKIHKREDKDFLFCVNVFHSPNARIKVDKQIDKESQIEIEI